MNYQTFYHLIASRYSESEARFLYQYIEREQPRIEMDEIVNRLSQGEPIDYILGYTYFYGLQIMVNQHTLIPRPETEELVDWVINENKHIPNLKILDIGTGSGCIALALAHNLPSAVLAAVDISDKALDITIQNMQNLNILLDVKIVNILESTTWDNFGYYDIIVSNPPYIKPSEKMGLSEQVRDYEPHIALFSEENNPIVFYEKILEFGLKHLNPNGLVYFETHQEYQLEDYTGYRIERKRDMSGNYRFLKANRI